MIRKLVSTLVASSAVVAVVGLSLLVSPAAEGAAGISIGKPLKVVLLGDSYSAGNGARDSKGERDYYGPKGCYRSHSNWAEQYVRQLRNSGYNVTFVNRACSGAVTADLLNEKTLESTASYLTSIEQVTSQAQALSLVQQADLCGYVLHYPDEERLRYTVDIIPV
jgi:lysophospholipase L1-like esterase